jgi:hypothetical protein
MSKALRLAIEELYATFAVYPLKARIAGCPCCVTEEDNTRLHAHPLRKLEREDLYEFCWSALLTWGDVEDFKYFLPRIFELKASGANVCDTFALLNKFEIGEWRTWPEREQQAVTRFLLADWGNLFQQENEVCGWRFIWKHEFFEIAKRLGSVEDLLQRSRIEFNNQSFLHFVDFIHECYSGLASGLLDLDKASTDRLLDWVAQNTDKLEAGFFLYAERDEDIADRISQALSILDILKPKT